MSGASKTKVVIFLCCGFIFGGNISTTLANTLPQDISYISSQEQQQDLSVLRKKLGERFSGVVQEVRSLFQNNIQADIVSQKSFEKTTSRILDVRQGIQILGQKNLQNAFSDIENDPYRSYINRLAVYGVLSSTNKFYPQNYFRTEDFLTLLSKVYQKKMGKNLNIRLTISSEFLTQQGMQELINSIDGVLPITLVGNTQDILTRSEGAYYIVRAFDLPVVDVSNQIDSSFVHNSSSVFSDIIGHPFEQAISLLAYLNIVNTKTDKFYPDNYVRHYDFTILLVNALLLKKQQSLSNTEVSYFVDVPSSSSYLSHVMYAADCGLIDYLVTSKDGQLYFSPYALITKHKVYQVLSKLLNIKFIYDPIRADQEKITRGELAQLLVKSFELQYPSTSVFSSFSSKVITGTINNTDNISLLKSLKKLLSMM